MSEYEYFDLMISARAAMGVHGMEYAAFLFGYLVVAYFVGASLTKFQVSILNVFYAILAPFPCIAAHIAAGEYSVLAIEYYEKFRPGESAPLFAQIVAPVAPIFLFGTWVLSVIFMFQTRSRGSTDQSLEPDA